MLALNLKPNPLLAASSVGVCTDLSLLLALEHFDQRRSVDQRSATGVDQDCVPLHFRQTLGIYQVSRLGRHGACRDTTCLSASSSSSGTSGLRAVVGDHFAAKAVGDTGDHTTDLPKADDPEGTPFLAACLPNPQR